MENVKKLIYFAIMTLITMCFIYVHYQHFSEKAVQASLLVNEFDDSDSDSASHKRTCEPFYAETPTPLPDETLSIGEGLQIILSFYEKHSGNTLSATDNAENENTADDKSLDFALNHGLIDLYTSQNLQLPLTRHKALSMICALMSSEHMQDIDISKLNLINNIPDLLHYSDAHSQTLELCRMGIIECETDDGKILADKIVTHSYISSVLERLENPGLRKHFFVIPKEKEEAEFKAVIQIPELPTGCEVTSLTAVLNHIGYDIDKLTLADEFLEKGEIGSTDQRRAFVGNPRSNSSYGCYAPVIVSCANKYLSHVGSPYKAYDLTGTEFSGLYEYIDKGMPIIIWATIGLVKSYPTDVWTIGENKVVWIAEEHCMVLHGYDKEKDLLLVADPLKGNVQYSRERFEERYNELFRQAVIIK